MSSRWFRLYDEVLDDPKVQRLSDYLFRALINLWCLASRGDGALPPLVDIAFALRTTALKVEYLLRDLIRAGLIDDADGVMRPHNWNGRQFKSDVSTERVKRFRKRSATVPGNTDATPTETPPDTDTDTEQKDTPARESTSQPFAGFAKKPAAGRKANGQAAGSRYPAWFEAIWAAYRPIASPNSSKSRALTAAKRLSEADREDCRAGLAGYVAWLRRARGKRADFPAQHLATFINGRGWEAFSEQSAQAPPPVTDAELQRIVDTINAEREREETDDLAH